MYHLTSLYDKTVATVQQYANLNTVKRLFMPSAIVEGADGDDIDYYAIFSNIVSGLLGLAGGAQMGITIFVLIFAVIVVNDAIFLPWFIRLFLFFYVLFNMQINPILLIGIPSYYIINLGFNAYHNSQLSADQAKTEKRSLLPILHGFIPILTWKSKSDSLLSFETLLLLFKYRAMRDPSEILPPGKLFVPPITAKELQYSKNKKNHVRYLTQLVPGFDKLKETNESVKALIESFNTYMFGLNNKKADIPEVVPNKKLAATESAAIVGATAPPALPTTKLNNSISNENLTNNTNKPISNKKSPNNTNNPISNNNPSNQNLISNRPPAPNFFSNEGLKALEIPRNSNPPTKGFTPNPLPPPPTTQTPPTTPKSKREFTPQPARNNLGKNPN